MAEDLDLSWAKGRSQPIAITVQQNSMPVDITDYTFTMTYRKNLESDVIFSLSTPTIDVPDGGITITSAVAGTLLISITPAMTADLEDESLSGIYDVTMYPPTGGAFTILEGSVNLSLPVTH